MLIQQFQQVLFFSGTKVYLRSTQISAKSQELAITAKTSNKQQPTNSAFLNRIFLAKKLPNGSTIQNAPNQKKNTFPNHLFMIQIQQKTLQLADLRTEKIRNGVISFFWLRPGATTHITRVIRIIFSRSVLGKSLRFRVFYVRTSQNTSYTWSYKSYNAL